MKQGFQTIPRGSSNTMLRNGGVEKKMRRIGYMALILVILASLATLSVNADVVRLDSYVMPGETVELPFTGTPGESFTVTVSNSKGLIESFELSFDESGNYIWSYSVNETASTDSYTVTATIDGVTQEENFIVSRMTPQLLANTVTTMADNSKKQAEAALMQAKRNGVLTDEALSAYREAVQQLSEARAFVQSGDHADALETVMEALDTFESIIDDSYTETAPPEIPVNQRELVRAQEALKKQTKTLEELKKTSNSLERHGFNVDLLERGINAVENELTLAKAAIDDIDLESAAEHLRQSADYTSTAQRFVKNKRNELSQRKTAAYQNTLTIRYNSMRTTLTVLQAANNDRVTAVLGELDSIEDRLDEARAEYSRGNVAESIRLLQSVDHDFKAAIREINGEDTKDLINSLDRLNTELEKTESTANRERLRKRINTVKDNLEDTLTDPEANDTPTTGTTPTDNTSLTP